MKVPVGFSAVQCWTHQENCSSVFWLKQAQFLEYRIHDTEDCSFVLFDSLVYLKFEKSRFESHCPPWKCHCRVFVFFVMPSRRESMKSNKAVFFAKTRKPALPPGPRRARREANNLTILSSILQYCTLLRDRGNVTTIMKCCNRHLFGRMG